MCKISRLMSISVVALIFGVTVTLAQSSECDGTSAAASGKIKNPVPKRVHDFRYSYFWTSHGEPDAELRSLMRADQILIVTCPDGCPKLIDDFRRGGGIVLTYISIYKAPILGQVPDNDNVRRWQGGSPDGTSAAKNPFWKAVDLTNHPDWMLYNEPNKPRRPFEDANYLAGWYQTNPQSEAYRQAVRKGVEAIVTDGRFDGVLLDNFIDKRKPMLMFQGSYEPMDPKTDIDAFHSLARAIRATGNRVSKGHFWIVINGDGDAVQQEIADAIELESFVYSWAWPGSSMNDQEALKKLTDPCMLLARGGRWLIMPYFSFGTKDIGADGRRMKRLANQANAILSDMFSLAKPSLVGDFARRNWAKQSGGQDRLKDPPALRALKSQVPGDPAAAREVFDVR
jgi:hypothetical protein